MIQLRKQLEQLMHIPQSEWTEADRDLINKVRNGMY